MSVIYRFMRFWRWIRRLQEHDYVSDAWLAEHRERIYDDNPRAQVRRQ